MFDTPRPPDAMPTNGDTTLQRSDSKDSTWMLEYCNVLLAALSWEGLAASWQPLCFSDILASPGWNRTLGRKEFSLCVFWLQGKLVVQLSWVYLELGKVLLFSMVTPFPMSLTSQSWPMFGKSSGWASFWVLILEFIRMKNLQLNIRNVCSNYTLSIFYTQKTWNLNILCCTLSASTVLLPYKKATFDRIKRVENRCGGNFGGTKLPFRKKIFSRDDVEKM